MAGKVFDWLTHIISKSEEVLYGFVLSVCLISGLQKSVSGSWFSIFGVQTGNPNRQI